MAILDTRFPTLLDLAKLSDNDGKVTSVIEILSETNEVLSEMSWKEGNLPTGERTTIRTGLPRPTWRAFNEFVRPTKSQTSQMTFNCGMLEAFAEVDCALADLNGNTSAFRLSEDRSHIEGMSQELANTIFYGDEGDEPAAFSGLTSYYSSTSAANGDNVILGGGVFGTAAVSTDDLSSMWLVVWGDNTVQGIVPKGSIGGMQMEDLGKIAIQGTSQTSGARDISPGRMMAYLTHYRHDAGLAVKDWRYAVRIANLAQRFASDQVISGITSATPSFVTLPELMHQAMMRIPNMGSGRAVWYMSAPIQTKFQQTLSRLVSESSLKMEMVGGKMTQTWMGMPIRRVDSLSGGQSSTANTNEALVS